MRDQVYRSAIRPLIVWILAWLWVEAAVAEDVYRPFVAAAPEGATVAEASAAVVKKLEGAGWEVVGQYAPYDDDSATIIGTTNTLLKLSSSGDKYGGFGGVIRVGITLNNGTVEVSYVNPTYMGFAYQIGDLSAVAEELKGVLGGGESFGAKGLSQAELGKYHYMMLMPYFKDREVIARFKSHGEAVEKVAAALQNPKSDMIPVWQVQLDGQQTLFGVKLERGKWKGQMRSIMDKIDAGTPKATAALPWELLVTGDEVVYLPGKFRIAVMFPDLTMGTFMQISEVPDNMDETAASFGELLQ